VAFWLANVGARQEISAGCSGVWCRWGMRTCVSTLHVQEQRLAQSGKGSGGLEPLGRVALFAA
jgi:hypothetical protein